MSLQREKRKQLSPHLDGPACQSGKQLVPGLLPGCSACGPTPRDSLLRLPLWWWRWLRVCVWAHSHLCVLEEVRGQRLGNECSRYLRPLLPVCSFLFGKGDTEARAGGREMSWPSSRVTGRKTCKDVAFCSWSQPDGQGTKPLQTEAARSFLWDLCLKSAFPSRRSCPRLGNQRGELPPPMLPRVGRG